MGADEGDEGGGRDEGDEVEEGQARHSDRQGQACPCGRLRWAQGENRHRHDQGEAHEELAWQDRLEGEVGHGQEALCDGLGPWTSAVKTARKALNLTGFVAINGKTAEGKA